MKKIKLALEINDLIEQCKNGNTAAERELFQRYANKIFTICRRYVRQKEEAYDLMQECFIKLFDVLEKHDAEKGSFDGWMHRICTNLILQKLRKNKRGVSLVFPDQLPEPDDFLILESFNEISSESLLSSIQELPEGYREVLNLYIFEGLQHAEIAIALGITASTSRSQYSRAKNILKNKLQEKIANKNNSNERRLA